MGSLSRQINKRSNRFTNALATLEKHLAEAQALNGDVDTPQPFNLSETVGQDLDAAKERKRKLRNKRKAEKKALKRK